MLGALGHVLKRRANPPIGESSAAWYVREETMMATAIRAELWAATADQAQAALDAVMVEMRRIERSMNAFDEASDLARINREAARAPVAIGAELFRLIERALAFSRRSEGAFDITFASVGHLYDYRRGIAPDEAALVRAREAVGHVNVILDMEAGTVAFAKPGVRIDLGGFAKGYAVDQAARILSHHGIAHATVSAGGDSRVIGDRCGRPWTIGIRHPRRAGEMIAVLPLQDVAISTSGDYERYFERDGVRCHHILDPRTGHSPSAIHSVTILAPDALTSEGVSKSVFVLGVERGLQFVESMPGVDAIVVDAVGALHYSSGLQSGNPAAAGETQQ